MKKTKAKAKRRIDKKLLAIVAGVALLISAQGFINYLLWRDSHIKGDPTVIRSLVIEANDNVYKSATVDPKTGNLYIPEAHLFMPAVKGPVLLRYSYTPASVADRQDEEIYLSAGGRLASKTRLFTGTKGTDISISEFFEQVPLFQACSREYLIKFNKSNSSISTSYSYTQKMTLADGRTSYLYENNDCTVKDTNFRILYFAGLQSY